MPSSGLTWYAGSITPPALAITNEQVDSLPLLIGIITHMGIRDMIYTHVTPHGNWAGPVSRGS